jgi:hypothetical protein
MLFWKSLNGLQKFVVVALTAIFIQSINLGLSIANIEGCIPTKVAEQSVCYQWELATYTLVMPSTDDPNKVKKALALHGVPSKLVIC